VNSVTAATRLEQQPIRTDHQSVLPVAANRSERRRKTGFERIPTAYMSVWAPTGRRTRWLGVTRCPRCGSGHAAYSANVAGFGGVKRAACGGGPVWIVVAKRYPGTEAVADVAAA
jgi:hypothetical protein